MKLHTQDGANDPRVSGSGRGELSRGGPAGTGRAQEIRATLPCLGQLQAVPAAAGSGGFVGCVVGSE